MILLNLILQVYFEFKILSEENNGWKIISSLLGWISFFLWSASFYPQCIVNYNTKSVAGFSVEFAMMNPVGFYAYTVYNLQGLINPEIGGTGQIFWNDLVFSIHAFILSSI